MIASTVAVNNIEASKKPPGMSKTFYKYYWRNWNFFKYEIYPKFIKIKIPPLGNKNLNPVNPS